MDDATLRARLWTGFARLQVLLGGQAANGAVVEEESVVVTFVPAAPDSPTLNALIALDDALDRDVLELHARHFDELGVRRWGVWADGAHRGVTRTLKAANMRVTSSSPGMGAELHELKLIGHAPAQAADLA